MEPIFVLALFLGSFFLGYFVHQKISRAINLDEKCQKTLKKHRDIVNWLKSDLSNIRKKKMDKNIDPKKVKLIELLISKLEK